MNYLFAQGVVGMAVSVGLVVEGLAQDDVDPGFAAVLVCILSASLILGARRTLHRNYVVVDPGTQIVSVVTAGKKIDVPFSEARFAIPQRPGPRYVHLESATRRVACTLLTQAKLGRSRRLRDFARHLDSCGIPWIADESSTG